MIIVRLAESGDSSKEYCGRKYASLKDDLSGRLASGRERAALSSPVGRLDASRGLRIARLGISLGFRV